MIKFGNNRLSYDTKVYVFYTDPLSPRGVAINDHSHLFVIDYMGCGQMKWDTAHTVAEVIYKDLGYGRSSHLPTLNEFRIIREHLDEVNKMLRQINGIPFECGVKYWSNTVSGFNPMTNDTDLAFCFSPDVNEPTSYNKNLEFNCRPIIVL